MARRAARVTHTLIIQLMLQFADKFIVCHLRGRDATFVMQDAIAVRHDRCRSKSGSAPSICLIFRVSIVHTKNGSMLALAAWSHRGMITFAVIVLKLSVSMVTSRYLTLSVGVPLRAD